MEVRCSAYAPNRRVRLALGTRSEFRSCAIYQDSLYGISGNGVDAKSRCLSYNCLSSLVCGRAADEPVHAESWVYALVGLGIVACESCLPLQLHESNIKIKDPTSSCAKRLILRLPRPADAAAPISEDPFIDLSDRRDIRWTVVPPSTMADGESNQVGAVLQ